ncbi:MAG: hypothetical protein HZA89_17250 [Verrucomicrobia bacterium]|nr:hypothetical protein [Verrucomicrobiota bacterium]
MKRATLGVLVGTAAGLGAFVSVAGAASLDTPTHKEIAPIKFPIGEEGALKTIAMDSRGNLLAGVSWKAGARGAAAPKPSASVNAAVPRREAGAPADSGKTLARLREAIQKSTPDGWDKLLKEVGPEDFRALMTNASQETRREIMPRLPENVRAKLMQGMGRPGGPGGPGGAPGQRGIRDTFTENRGGISPQLSIDHEGHTYALKVVSPEGKVLATWPMTDGLAPKMIFGCDDGTVYVAGGGRLAQFTAEGRLVKMVDTDKIYGQKAAASGLCADGQHVFIAFGMGNSLRATEDFYRFKRDLTEPKMIVERQYGCCSHIDLRVVGNELLIAENSRHRVNRFDLDGKALGTWGRRDRENLAGFTACCNPCNFDLGPGGVLYTAESGIGRVKKYSPDGKFLGLVGYVDTTKFDNGSQLAAQSCYIPIEVNKDASRVYVMDVRAATIRVLAKVN